MQSQSVVSRPVLHPPKRLLRFGFRTAQNHKVIGITSHLYTSARRQVVQRVEVNVGQQRRDYSLYEKDNLGWAPLRRGRKLVPVSRWIQGHMGRIGEWESNGEA